MPTFWCSIPCKSETPDATEPGSNCCLCNDQTRKPCMSSCSESFSNIKDVIQGSKKPAERQQTCSPRSLQSADCLNPFTYEVFRETTSEPKLSRFAGGSGSGKDGSSSSGNLRTAGKSLGLGDHDTVLHYSTRKSVSFPRRKNGELPVYGGGKGTSSQPRQSLDAESLGSATLICKKCDEKFKRLDAVEEHHLAKHAVTELTEGESSRRIVEIICRMNQQTSDNNHIHIERILKVHHMLRTIAQFEEHRERVKIRASKLPSKHPRCLTDGNELLRFYGTTLACSLNGSSGVCRLQQCGVCQILRHGFTSRELNGGLGVFTTSSSEKAFQSIELCADNKSVRKALLVCRVIAGRVHKPVENFKEMADRISFDSLAGEVGQNLHIEELYLLSPKALLPCFVVICKH